MKTSDLISNCIFTASIAAIPIGLLVWAIISANNRTEAHEKAHLTLKSDKASMHLHEWEFHR